VNVAHLDRTSRIRVGAGAPGDPAGGNDYDVVIGHGLLGELPGLLGDQVRRVFVLHSRNLRATGDRVREVLSGAGYHTVPAEVPDAEAAKTASVLQSCWELLGRAGFTRSDAVVGVGGGTVTDLAGFVAATWLRGVRVVLVPTTLLAMVDAAVGGKTGINTAEGKNLVGAFHPPAGVLCDLGALATLPHHELVAGLAEVVKCGLIDDARILSLVEEEPSAATTWDSGVVRELVERSVAVKAKVVSADLREARLREVLNYGHTFAHAIEQVERYTWRHGEAVGVGMVYAAELAARTGHLQPADVARHRALLSGLGLPVGYRDDRWTVLLEAMRRDKKTRGDLLRFVILDGIGHPIRLEGPSEEVLEDCYRALCPD